MLPVAWKPTPAAGMVRVGGLHDGGYALPAQAVAASRVLVSMGLEADWAFEEEFLEQTNGGVVCFDHTVTTRWWVKRGVISLLKGQLTEPFKYFGYKRFFSSPRADHRLIKIGYDGTGSASLRTILAEVDETTPVMLKIDIEGSEYRILDQIVADQGRFTAVVMEFHDVDLHRSRISEFLAALDDFSVVWLHGNNYGGVDDLGDPLVIELSLVRRDLCQPVRDGETADLSAPNDPDRPEIQLIFG